MDAKPLIDNGKVRRFGPHRIIEHQLGLITFVVLVLTGFCQRFPLAAWSQGLVSLLGGIDTVRLIHRYTGVAFALLVIEHVAVGLTGFLVAGWRPSMVVTKADFTHAVENLRYYFGRSDHPARCDRYDYKQKFEYWGVVLGGMIMIGSGVLLWFPTEVFQLVPFMPGEVIPAAKVAHSNEAMLALLVIVIWHMYNAVISPEVFPLDTTIFTGKMSVERMRHEHPLELERILEESGAASEGAVQEGKAESPEDRTNQEEPEVSPSEKSEELVAASGGGDRCSEGSSSPSS